MSGSVCLPPRLLMKTKNKLALIALILLFIATGFFREFVFVNWNEQMRVTYYHSPDPHVAPSMQWLGTFTYAGLYYLKWPLTLMFTLIFMGYSMLCVHFAFPEKHYLKITAYVYAGTFLLSLLIFTIGWLLNERQAFYVISRFLAGLIETPAMLIILMAGFMIHRRMIIPS